VLKIALRLFQQGKRVKLFPKVLEIFYFCGVENCTEVISTRVKS